MDPQESCVEPDADETTWRDSFSTLTAYMYVDHWLAVLKAERNAACVELNDEWTEEEKTLHLINSGYCIQKVKVRHMEKQKVWRFSWSPSQDSAIGRKFEKNTSFILSRTNPEEDGWYKYQLRVKERSPRSIDVCATCKLPSGAAGGNCP